MVHSLAQMVHRELGARLVLGLVVQMVHRVHHSIGKVFGIMEQHIIQMMLFIMTVVHIFH